MREGDFLRGFQATLKASPRSERCAAAFDFDEKEEEALPLAPGQLSVHPGESPTPPPEEVRRPACLRGNSGAATAFAL